MKPSHRTQRTLQEIQAQAMEALKPFNSLLEPDPRFAEMMLWGDEEAGTTYDLLDHYERFALLAPPANAPVEVVSSFVTAQHLALASWWFFPFSVVAEGQAYGALELALRRRMNSIPAHGLRERIDYAIRAGWLRPDELLEVKSRIHTEPT